MGDVRDQRDRQVRAARNQALFRKVNERLEGLSETFQLVAQTASFVCECADTSCLEHMNLRLDEYETLCRDPNRFAVVQGHVYPDVERVVSENERFVVVAKIGDGAKYVTEHDPRS